jgi:hypothetical protein
MAVGRLSTQLDWQASLWRQSRVVASWASNQAYDEDVARDPGG